MKYRMLIKPFEGCELGLTKSCANNRYLATKNKLRDCPEFYCYESDIPDLIIRGIIEEIQEPTWTDRDMIDFAKRFLTDHTYYNIVEKLLLQFKRERGI